MKKIQDGFTLIEVLTVIILISILAATAISKFSGSDSFEAYTYRSSLISDLRLTQQRAMQQTNGIHCHQIVFDTVTKDHYGVPDRTDCDETDFDGWTPDKTGLDLRGSRYNVTFSIEGGGNLVSFDSMGRPKENCATEDECIIINITNTGTDETVKIEIESEGYIHGI